MTDCTLSLTKYKLNQTGFRNSLKSVEMILRMICIVVRKPSYVTKYNFCIHSEQTSDKSDY